MYVKKYVFVFSTKTTYCGPAYDHYEVQNLIKTKTPKSNFAYTRNLTVHYFFFNRFLSITS